MWFPKTPAGVEDFGLGGDASRQTVGALGIEDDEAVLRIKKKGDKRRSIGIHNAAAL